MAHLSDVPHVFRTIGTIAFAKRVWKQVGEDNLFTWGAALAYSWMFAIFPFLICLLSLVPFVPERFKPAIQEQVNQAIDSAIPSDGGKEMNVGTIMKEQAGAVLNNQSTGGFLSVGLLLTIWAASGGMTMTMTALDKAYDIEKGRSFIRQRLVAIGLTLAVASMMILVMVLLPIGTGIISWLAKQGSIFGKMLVLVQVARIVVAVALLVGITALIYHFGPSLRAKFHAVSPGAIFTIVVWLLLGLVFKLYITNFGGADSYKKTYGAVAGLVILLLFFYIDALVLLIGAEINSELDFAVTGLASGDTPEERAVAPLHDAETQALKKELEAKRGECEGAPADEAAKNKPRFQVPAIGAKATVIAIAGLWATVKIVQSLVGGQARSQQRATRLPITRAALERKYGVQLDGNDRT